MGAVKFFFVVKQFGQPVEQEDLVPGWPKKFAPHPINPGFEIQIVDDLAPGFTLSAGGTEQGTLHEDGSGGASADAWANGKNVNGNLGVIVGSTGTNQARGTYLYITGTPALSGHTIPSKGDKLTNLTESADGIAEQTFWSVDNSGNPVLVTVFFKKMQADIA